MTTIRIILKLPKKKTQNLVLKKPESISLNLGIFEQDYFLENQDFFFDLSRFINWRIECIVQLFIWKHNVYKQMRRSIVSSAEKAQLIVYLWMHSNRFLILLLGPSLYNF